MKEKNILQAKKYHIWDFIRIPLKVCPGCTLIIGINRIIGALIPALTVLVTADFVDKAVNIFEGKAEFSEIILPLLLYILIILYDYMRTTIIVNFVNVRYDMKIFRYFRAELIDKRAKLKYEYVEDNETWDLINRTCGDALQKIATGMNVMFDIAELFINAGSILLILMTQAWWAALAITIVIIPFVMIAAKGGKNVYEANKEAEKYNRRAKYLEKVLSDRENVEERTMFSYSDMLGENWHEKYETSRKISLKVDLKYYIIGRLGSLVTLIIAMIIIGILLIPLETGAVTLGLFIGMVEGTMSMVSQISWRLPYVTSQFTNNREYLKDLTKVMNLEEEKDALSMPAELKDDIESIRFENVTFMYPNTDKYILKNFTTEIHKNKHYAIVGINGAGKTTITKLLTGMYDNYDGNIFINDKELREYSLAELKSMFSVVYQDFAKYYISFRDNIVIGNVKDFDREDLSDVKIEQLIEKLEMKEAVEELKDGMNTYLGKIKEDGVDLSGGQWQRLAIIRALYNKAKVQILDEPTAALDPVAESKIYKIFGEISKGKTTIFITHRLGAAKLADEIIVVEDGKVAEQGSHEELIKLRGIYEEMFASQRSWYQYE